MNKNDRIYLESDQRCGISEMKLPLNSNNNKQPLDHMKEDWDRQSTSRVCVGEGGVNNHLF